MWREIRGGVKDKSRIRERMKGSRGIERGENDLSRGEN